MLPCLTARYGFPAQSVSGTALVKERQRPKLMELWLRRTSIPYHRLLIEILE